MKSKAPSAKFKVSNDEIREAAEQMKAGNSQLEMLEAGPPENASLGTILKRLRECQGAHVRIRSAAANLNKLCDWVIVDFHQSYAPGYPQSQVGQEGYGGMYTERDGIITILDSEDDDDEGDDEPMEDEEEAPPPSSQMPSNYTNVTTTFRSTAFEFCCLRLILFICGFHPEPRIANGDSQAPHDTQDDGMMHLADQSRVLETIDSRELSWRFRKHKRLYNPACPKLKVQDDGLSPLEAERITGIAA
ncbi:hypothetical protein F4604DRAFT_1676370 [Suillus subluteus]|nr:hypothetical protein F4604DRAFT_1676370 [Suillus subluteus]